MRPEIYLIYENVNRLLNSGHYANSLAYLDSAYAEMEDIQPLEEWNRYFHLARYYLNYVSDLEMADRYKDSMNYALKGKEHIYQAEFAKNYFVKGDVLKANKRFSEAFKNYYEGREFARQRLPPCQTADLTYQLGLFKYNQREYQEAIIYVKRALDEVLQCPSGSGFVVSVKDPQMYWNTIALAFEKLEELDSAVHYYETALDFIASKKIVYPQSSFQAESNFVEVARGVVLGNIGGVFAEMGEVEKAEKALQESIQINDRPGYDIPDARTAKIKLGNLYLKLNQPENALDVIQKLDVSIKNIEVKNEHYENILSRFYNLRWHYYDSNNTIDSAYRDLLAFLELYKVSELKATESRYLDMEESFRSTEQQLQLANITRANDMKKLYLMGSVVITLIAFGFLIAVWYHLKRHRLINKQISKQNIELQDALGALEQSQAENSKMMHMVAHDLRSPISSMTMIADVLLESENWSDEDRTLLEHIKLSGDNSLNLVSEMMQVNRGSEGIKKESVDLERMIHYCVDLLRHRADEKQQKIVVETVPLTALVSREKMWRVMSNLIANAIKFSEIGGLISVRLSGNQNKALITVKDMGIGIPDKIKDSVFELFTNSKRVGTAGETPYGMGLAISKQIVTAHEGSIWFESKEGKGTTFFVEMPLL
ncbi:tetratricopeptide repeat-containing sensor histidine kinase [Lunatibacter salilacus]|uniref:tetratricopeptide repeat-containing sensor histidine kinase n=1 Tax=Lunatibacter salilacus TaxID=2483804 RepID=UPI00131B556A|nr:ATP-binding protein [Lunatibacter salilacus]